MDYYDIPVYTSEPTIYHVVEGKSTFLDWRPKIIRKEVFSNHTKEKTIRIYNMIPFTLPMLLKKYSPLWSREPAKEFIRDYLVALAENK